MLTAGLSEVDARTWLSRYGDDEVVIACINSPSNSRMGSMLLGFAGPPITSARNIHPGSDYFPILYY